ncbi:MAG TPA: exopolysaccharide biosynthesis polyprenyl glycosylphosphotransferase [Solirubrobacteraceae bacterium]|nr:exopolysaccharide biosynthesis polyprenyl glycosylphosphotransferase [Solirubrobacteraceae bacterium]
MTARAIAAREVEAPQGLLATTPVRSRSKAWSRDSLRRRLLAGGDAAALICALLACGLGTSNSAPRTLVVVFAAAVGSTILGKALRLYDRDHRVLRHGIADEMPNLLAWAATIAVAAAAGGPLLGGPALTGTDVAWFFAALLGAAITLRGCSRVLWREITPPERVLIVGSGPLAAAARRKLDLFSDLHLEVVGVIGDEILHSASAARMRAFLDDLTERHGSVDRIVIATTTASESLIVDLMPLCRAREIKLGLVPPARAMFGTAVVLDHLAELPVVQYNTWDVSRTTLLAKRALDVCGALVALLLTLPLLPVLAVAIRLDSAGPVFFRQRRAGRGGRPFVLIKLRTMVSDAEAQLANLVVLDDLPSPVFKLRHDPRVTRLGRRLRRISVDELPQLWNVLRGDMSLVGPRPEQVELAERYSPEAQLVRLSLKPGMTGPMQVSGRGALTLEERLAVEREYVENLSLSRDVKILAQTVAAVLRGRGAY